MSSGNSYNLVYIILLTGNLRNMVFSTYTWCWRCCHMWFYMQLLFTYSYFLSCLRDSNISSHYYPTVHLDLCALLNGRCPKVTLLTKYIYFYTCNYVCNWQIWYTKSFFIKNEVFLRTENDIFLIKIVDMYMLYTYMFMCVYTL